VTGCYAIHHLFVAKILDAMYFFLHELTVYVDLGSEIVLARELTGAAVPYSKIGASRRFDVFRNRVCYVRAVTGFVVHVVVVLFCERLSIHKQLRLEARVFFGDRHFVMSLGMNAAKAQCFISPLCSASALLTLPNAGSMISVEQSQPWLWSQQLLNKTL
jgi:hypothetical protein